MLIFGSEEKILKQDIEAQDQQQKEETRQLKVTWFQLPKKKRKKSDMI